MPDIIEQLTETRLVLRGRHGDVCERAIEEIDNLKRDRDILYRACVATSKADISTCEQLRIVQEAVSKVDDDGRCTLCGRVAENDDDET